MAKRTTKRAKTAKATGKARVSKKRGAAAAAAKRGPRRLRGMPVEATVTQTAQPPVQPPSPAEPQLPPADREAFVVGTKFLMDGTSYIVARTFRQENDDLRELIGASGDREVWSLRALREVRTDPDFVFLDLSPAEATIYAMVRRREQADRSRMPL